MDKKLLIAIIITLITAVAFAGLMFKMVMENGKCIDNPFGYSATKLKESGGYYSCSCQSLDPELLSFSFDEEGVKIIKPGIYEDIDFSNIKFNTVERG